MASAQLVAMSKGGMIARAKDKAIGPAGHGATDRHLPEVRRPDRGTPRCHDTDPIIHGDRDVMVAPSGGRPKAGALLGACHVVIAA
ncbi:hypothetical protein GCM10010317_082430 [Streptomyces mirabilis]|uniref:hypothetical protein n=1 Tax=Streptomyces mirabilis TaxID=68239 RepID=UPI000C1ADCA2|nr:hypothetical protein [Streptomyces mirabilis]GHD72334.1 hypothetical protein GCM10010317_082430 [Streptomyces mirabilis]